MIFPYKQGPCTRDCADRCVEPNCQAYLNWAESIRVKREAATEVSRINMAQRARIIETKKACGFYD
jgi:hypothetical protein